VGARRSDAESLRLAALRSWLVPSNTLASPPDLTVFDTSPDQENLRTFAERVREAARASTTGRFGGDKIFISHVWHTLKHQVRGLDERAFKDRLLEANRARLLSLSRADLVEAMDPADVAASETRYLGATFHFIAL
jgi:hypothetical protein